MNIYFVSDVLRAQVLPDRSISNFCEKAQNIVSFNVDCKDMINPLEILISSNNLKFESLSHLISNKRQKRALEFGGEILKFFLVH